MNKGIKKTGAGFLSKLGLREKIIEPPAINMNKPIVFYAHLEKIQSISEENGKTGNDIPEKLIIKKGTYRFHGKSYDLNKEGVYRFLFPGVENKQRIVFEDDVNALLSSIAWVFSHGNLDDTKTEQEIIDKAMYSKISATCGTISEWSKNFLMKNGVKSRLVSSLTLDSWNSYDNGHIMIEVFRPELKKWVVYDIDNDAYFINKQIPLSLIELVEKIKDGDFIIEYIARKNDIDVKNFLDKKNNYDYGFLIESRFSDEQTRREWYKHILQVPMIVDDDFSYFFDKDNAEKILSYSSYYKYLDQNEFMKRFY